MHTKIEPILGPLIKSVNINAKIKKEPLGQNLMDLMRLKLQKNVEFMINFEETYTIESQTRPQSTSEDEEYDMVFDLPE